MANTVFTPTIALALAFTGFIIASPVLAADENNTAPGLTAAGAPLGLHGVDPVAFLDINNRVEGRAEFTAVHEDVAYYFSTKKNMTKFKTNPTQYLPQNGGFCTYGVSIAKKFDGDPQFSAVQNGKLYVFLNEEIYKLFQTDRAGTIVKAANNWTKIEHASAREL